MQPLWRTIWRFLQKLKIELPYDHTVQLLDIYQEKNVVRKHTCTQIFIAALFTIAKTRKQLKCIPAEALIKEMCTYIQQNISHPLKRMK